MYRNLTYEYIEERQSTLDDRQIAENFQEDAEYPRIRTNLNTSLIRAPSREDSTKLH